MAGVAPPLDVIGDVPVTLVTPPPPPDPWFDHEDPFHTRVRLLVVLKYSDPVGGEAISASA
jgi:hypothetical protein